jgi:ubiquinone/menaquinone biosynthesis C-methylase UbiE
MIDEKRIIETKLQKITVERRDFSGKIIDIGGGGEGIVGMLYGKQAISIDKRQDELDEAENDAQKIVMDACNLEFEDESFDAEAFFYSLMYMNSEEKTKALSEAIRVLKHDGILEIWDTEIPQYDGGEKDVFLTHLDINVSDKSVKTSYGVGLDGKRQTFLEIKSAIESIGVKIIDSKKAGSSFYISAVKI